MTSDLLVVLPTRGRPESVRRFLDGFAATARLPADLAIVADGDDEATLEVLASPPWGNRGTCGAAELRPPWLKVYALPRAPTAAKVNHAAMPGALTHRAVMFLGDDNVFVTEGWDRAVMDALDGMGGGMVYVNDLGERENIIACNWAVSSAAILALGYLDYPGCSHYCVDNVLWEIFGALDRRRYLPDVIIEHRHPLFGKAPEDALYSETGVKWWASDHAVLERWREHEKEKDIERVREALLK